MRGHEIAKWDCREFIKNVDVNTLQPLFDSTMNPKTSVIMRSQVVVKFIHMKSNHVVQRILFCHIDLHSLNYRSIIFPMLSRAIFWNRLVSFRLPSQPLYSIHHVCFVPRWSLCSTPVTLSHLFFPFFIDPHLSFTPTAPVDLLCPHCCQFLKSSSHSLLIQFLQTFNLGINFVSSSPQKLSHQSPMPSSRMATYFLIFFFFLMVYFHIAAKKLDYTIQIINNIN